MRCGQRKHSFLDDPVGELLLYLRQPRPWANKIVAIAHNAKAFDLYFILNGAIMLKWKPELIMSGLKIMCMKMEHLVFLDSVSFLPCSLRKLPEAFGLSASKSWYPHYYNTKENLNYVRPIPTFRIMEWTGYGKTRGKNFSSGTRVRDPRLSTTGTFWNPTSKMTSPY